jgi:hypothetical protein
LEFSIPLNKFEKHDLVIRLLKEGKTYREICHIAHIAPRDIKLISKKYKQHKRLEQNKKENNNNKSSQIKKLSLSSQAFKLFKEGKKPTDVAIILDIQYPKVSKFWYQFLKLEKKFDCYEFYEVWQYDLPSLLSISNFMKRNDVSGTDIANVLRTANDVINLNQTYLNLKTETKYLEQKRTYLLDYSHSGYSLQPLPLNKSNYNYYHY